MVDFKEINGGLEVKNNEDFNIRHILECGQLFRFEKTSFGYLIYAKNQKVEVYCQKATTKIFCKDVNFIKKYFDFDCDYARIKGELSSKFALDDAIKFGHGIRILNSDPLEMIISFIISANNNIPRIKKIINSICKMCGSYCETYYAFPTLTQLETLSENDFRAIGCGYRAPYLVETIKQLKCIDINEIKNMPTSLARNELLKLKGVGRKVADCILLFGFHKTDVFPADVWIVKVYNELNGTNLQKASAKKISEWFVNKFGELSGFAQQYLYYERMFRNKEIK